MAEDTIDNKTIRTKRIRHYFVEAAKRIIREEGIGGVTLRKVAKGAGYNGATLYNYFRNVDHVISLALHEHMGHYVNAVLEALRGDETPFELYKLDWYIYAEKSFRLPKEYYYLFYKHPDINLSEVYNEFFKNHPDIFERLPEPFQEMAREKSQYSRDLAFLKTNCSHIDRAVLERVSEMNILIHKSMLADLCEYDTPITEDISNRYTEKFKTYFSVITRDIKSV